MLIDTHCHLTDPRYNGGQEIIDNMESDGLEKIITVAYDIPSSFACADIADKNANVYATAGVHPSDACRMEKGYDPIQDLRLALKREKVVALGEIGLDYHFGDDKDIQKHWLCRQLEVLAETNLPVSFHVRDSYEDMLSIVKQNKTNIKNGGVMHCFSGSYETAKIYVDMGFYISFAGPITFKNNNKAEQIIKNLPLERILIETDSPYLTPVPYRGQLNRPAYVKYQAQKIADVVGKDYEEIVDITTNNAYTLFTKMKR